MLAKFSPSDPGAPMSVVLVTRRRAHAQPLVTLPTTNKRTRRLGAVLRANFSCATSLNRVVLTEYFQLSPELPRRYLACTLRTGNCFVAAGSALMRWIQKEFSAAAFESQSQHGGRGRGSNAGNGKEH